MQDAKDGKSAAAPAPVGANAGKSKANADVRSFFSKEVKAAPADKAAAAAPSAAKPKREKPTKGGSWPDEILDSFGQPSKGTRSWVLEQANDPAEPAAKKQKSDKPVDPDVAALLKPTKSLAALMEPQYGNRIKPVTDEYAEYKRELAIPAQTRSLGGRLGLSATRP